MSQAEVIELTQSVDNQPPVKKMRSLKEIKDEAREQDAKDLITNAKFHEFIKSNNETLKAIKESNMSNYQKTSCANNAALMQAQLVLLSHFNICNNKNILSPITIALQQVNDCGGEIKIDLNAKDGNVCDGHTYGKMFRGQF